MISSMSRSGFSKYSVRPGADALASSLCTLGLLRLQSIRSAVFPISKANAAPRFCAMKLLPHLLLTEVTRMTAFLPWLCWMILVRKSRNTWTAESSLCWGWIMPRCARSAALSKRTSFLAIRGMVSGCAPESATMAVPGEGIPPAVATGTTCRLPLPSRALLSAFSILLISQHLYEAYRGDGCRRGDRRHHNQAEKHDFPAQTFQLRRAPKVRDDRYYRHLVRHSYRASDTYARIELQPREQQSHGKQYADEHASNHKMPEPWPDGGLRQSNRLLDLECQALAVAI